MPNPSNAAKAFIVKDKAVLFLKRRPNDVHKPLEWDIPGGRLNPGESPFLGLARETKEETGLEITIEKPLEVHYFTREDGQVITLIIFLCSLKSKDITLSEEHTEYKWLDLNSDVSLFPKWLQGARGMLVDERHRLTAKKPWGKFEQFTLNEKSSVKIISANPQSALSLQYHHNRDELWRILSGEGEVIINDATKPARAGDEFFIPRQTKHRMLTKDSGVEWLEISFGEFDEQDIVRLEDTYGRV